MGKNKGKKKQSKKPTTGSNTNNDTETKSVQKRPKMPFEVKEALDLRGHTVDELIALTRATDEWTDEVKKWCSSKVDIRLFGSQAASTYYKSEMKSEYISIDFVIVDGKMREKKMIQLAQQVIALFPNLYGFTVYYHPRLNHLFPLLLEQITTTSDHHITLHTLCLDKAPKEPKWATKWWTAISMIPVLKSIQLVQPGELPPIIYEHANRLAHVRKAQITQFDWDLVPLFKQFGPRLEELELQVNMRLNCDLDELDRLLEDNPRIGANLTKLHFGCADLDLISSAVEDGKLLRLIVKRFTKLKVLHLSTVLKVRFEDVFNEIAKLPQLEELCISALFYTKYVPKSVDHLVPNTTVVRLQMYNPIDQYIHEFGRVIVPLFPNLAWIGVSSVEKDNVEQFRAQLPVWYPDPERTKYQVIWHDGHRREVFEHQESPMDDPDKWIGWEFTRKGRAAIAAALEAQLPPFVVHVTQSTISI